MTDVGRSCKQPIRWATTRNGYPIPLDPEPAANGNLHVDDDGRATIVPRDRRATAGALYVSHFATCPYADQHRRRP
jgi:hypothetical protein